MPARCTCTYLWPVAELFGYTAAGVFPVGHRLTETSNHFIDTRRIYQELVNAGVQHVFAKPFIAWPLMVHDLEQRRLQAHAWNPTEQPPAMLGGLATPFAMVFYNGKFVEGRKTFAPQSAGGGAGP